MNDLLTDITSNKGIRLALTAALGLLALFLLALTINAFSTLGQSEYPAMNTISVTGEGETTVVPDIARITFTVQETAPSVAAAQEVATNRTNEALEAMREQGVEEKDLKTLNYNVYPQYDYGQPCYSGMVCPTRAPSISGYQVSQSVEVKVRETENVGQVLEALGTLGVQNISGPEFGLDDEDAGRAEARAEAIADAREKAKQLAKDLGVRLGTVVSYYEESGYPGPMYYDGYGKGGAMMETAQSAPSVPTGENESVVRVNVTFEIH